MAAMVGKVNDDRILIDAHFLQLVHQPPQILVQRRALTQIVGVFFPVIAAQHLQISGRGEVRILFFGADGAFIVVVVVLVVRFNMGDGHEEGLLPPVLLQKFQREVRDAVYTVSREINAVVVLVKHKAVVAVAGEFQNVTGAPKAGIAAPQLPGDGGDGMVDGGLLFQLAVGRQVPLADVGCFVTGLLHIRPQRLYIGREHDIIAEAADIRRPFAGLEHGAAGAADGLRGEGQVKPGAFRSQLIQNRRNGKLLTVAAAGIRPLLVGKVQQNVLLFHIISPFSVDMETAFHRSRRAAALKNGSGQPGNPDCPFPLNLILITDYRT